MNNMYAIKALGYSLDIRYYVHKFPSEKDILAMYVAIYIYILTVWHISISVIEFK